MSQGKKPLAILDRIQYSGARRIPTHGWCSAREGEKPCTLRTNHMKPYCEEHLKRMPAVGTIVDELRARDEELNEALKRHGWKRIDVHGTRAQDIVRIVFAYRRLTIERLAIKAELYDGDGARIRGGRRAIESYVRALEQHGILQSAREKSAQRGQFKHYVSCGPEAEKFIGELDAEILAAEPAAEEQQEAYSASA